jgi:hypothetical protein
VGEQEKVYTRALGSRNWFFSCWERRSSLLLAGRADSDLPHAWTSEAGFATSQKSLNIYWLEGQGLIKYLLRAISCSGLIFCIPAGKAGAVLLSARG